MDLPAFYGRRAKRLLPAATLVLAFTAIGTWLLPLGIAHLGIRACMLIGAAMCAGGALMSHSMAPETTGKALTRTSG